jgi:hypothetical protein
MFGAVPHAEPKEKWRKMNKSAELDISKPYECILLCALDGCNDWIKHRGHWLQ